ncbi:HNH endonuclease [Polaribacter septentrionalilitoris]|uniref:HNH endonuclease n=1 Tax=Polaribacter septentrionalilitoris TaxID=2494657 RepID=UPI0013568E86|nr:hypothetical protein [Polaribacter septentrionalilitoris]
MNFLIFLGIILFFLIIYGLKRLIFDEEEPQPKVDTSYISKLNFEPLSSPLDGINLQLDLMRTKLELIQLLEEKANKNTISFFSNEFFEDSEFNQVTLEFLFKRLIFMLKGCDVENNSIKPIIKNIKFYAKKENTKENRDLKLLKNVFGDFLPQITRWKNEKTLELDKHMSVEELIISKSSDSDVKYLDLLNCFEWKYMRLKILFRDNFTCKDCGSYGTSHSVHHRYYIKNRFPWEYQPNALVSLCNECHKNRHQNEEIVIYEMVQHKVGFYDIYDKLIEVDTYKKKCYRCGGIGYISQYSHVQNGICFACNGDSIHNSIFSFRINQFYYSDNYLEQEEREKYRKFIENLSYFDIEEIKKDLEIDVQEYFS